MINKMNTEKFIEKLLDLLPKTKELFDEEASFQKEINNGALLETVIIENVFSKHIVEILCENNNTQLLINLFQFLEDVSNSENKDLINIMSVTILEVLGNDKAVLKVAYNYMGEKTKVLQIEAEKNLGRY